MVEKMMTPNKKKVLPPIVRVEDCPENLYMPKAEFVKRRKAQKEAQKKAAEAYAKSMADSGAEETINPALTKADSDVRKLRQLASTLSKQLNSLQEDLKDAGPGEIKDAKSAIKKTERKIDETKLKLEECEETYEKIKSQA